MPESISTETPGITNLMAMFAAGKARGKGAVAPELAFDSDEVFAELQGRQILVHHPVFSPPGEP